MLNKLGTTLIYTLLVSLTILSGTATYKYWETASSVELELMQELLKCRAEDELSDILKKQFIIIPQNSQVHILATSGEDK